MENMIKDAEVYLVDSQAAESDAQSAENIEAPLCSEPQNDAESDDLTTAGVKPTDPQEAELSYGACEKNYSDDLMTLCRQFPEIMGSDAAGAVGSERYRQLRALGLTPAEAYLATGAKRQRTDNRSHLVTSVPNGSYAPAVGMTQREMNEARELFGDLSDSEIKQLYNKVTK